ncbi:helix-turn-helix transcriptional regulator [Paenibacillus glycanilyticus]|uniref:Transcriptional regulator n=1 Tax=Paenibacillus glycanilyticus TaxID=126569 RepID=A0ABQ6GFZ7_9BACL|nr:helix-turn-helix transcriptional regulator [Paenibacillus glycanilyticus]GLX68582.1 transcriptional regulator [Paenibacillus glycanilyticus]
MTEISSRTPLAEFLRSRRERLSPEDVGLVAYGRRRTTGLRREEVAQLAHIGTSWYTSLEQGRDVNPSEEVLNNIALALRLTETERHHLHLLARPLQPEQQAEQELTPGLERMIQILEPNPAFIIGRYWDLLHGNKASELVFQLPPTDKPHYSRTNWMRHLLTLGSLESNSKDWEARVKILIAQFRADYARYPNDPRFKELIEEFMQTSPLFKDTWPLNDVQAITDHHKRKYDPLIGEMEFEHVTLQPTTNPDMRIMMFIASPDTADRLQQLISNRLHHSGLEPMR